MKTLKIIIAAALLVLPLSLGAQTKAETSLYGKTIRKFSIKAADKFLKKYPNSVYATKVLHLKDSVMMAEYMAANVST
ncbi:MAG: hypothetical protein IK113_10230, partial [Bacteroidales bacterium]|nr:hypothetical protein [Bacteroidales bacterium]